MANGILCIFLKTKTKTHKTPLKLQLEGGIHYDTAGQNESLDHVAEDSNRRAQMNTAWYYSLKFLVPQLRSPLLISKHGGHPCQGLRG